MQTQCFDVAQRSGSKAAISPALASIERDLTCNILQTLWALRVRTSVDRTQPALPCAENLLDTHHLVWEAYDAVHRCASVLRGMLEMESSDTAINAVS